jgi:SAM-dependent methyltransferase
MLPFVRRPNGVDYERIVRQSIDRHRDRPAALLGIGDAKGEYEYLNWHVDSYVRTVRDVDGLFRGDKKDVSILEIASFLGAVSIPLRTLGYRVSALDIPEFHRSTALRSLYESHGIPFVGQNLRTGKLPYDSESFDSVIACEVIEHLNFNPLPFFQEVNRVLKPGGYFYIGMPNQAHIVERIKLALGRSTRNPVDDYFKQLDRSDNMVVGLHWREYTLAETVQLIRRMGFEPVRSYYFTEGGAQRNLGIKLVKRVLYAVPSFRPYQVVIGQKVAAPQHDFWLTEANS